MVGIRPIRTEEDCEAALARIADLMDALSRPQGQIEDPDHADRVELDVLTVLVEDYESKTVAMGFPTAIDAIEFRMDQAGLTRRDLAPFIGSPAKVSEVLSGKRAITMSMARALHRHLGIPADVLLQEPGASLHDAVPHVEWPRFPLKALAKAGWIPDRSQAGGPRGRDRFQADGARRRQGAPRFFAHVPQERPPARQRKDRRLRPEGVVSVRHGKGARTPPGRPVPARHRDPGVPAERWLCSARQRTVPAAPETSWPVTASPSSSCGTCPRPIWTGPPSGCQTAGRWSG